MEDNTLNSLASMLILVRISNCLCRNVENVLEINVANNMDTDGTIIPLMAGAITFAFFKKLKKNEIKKSGWIRFE